MSTTPTTNYGFLKPTDANDDDAWGAHLNTSLDDIDATLKTVSDVADGAAADAAAALAAVGGTASITLEEVTTTGGGGFNLSADNSSAFIESHSVGGVTTVTAISSLANTKAVRKTFVAINSSGGAHTFVAGSGVSLLVADIGSGGNSVSAQGRNIIEVYFSKTTAGVCTCVLKRIGVTTV